MAWIWILFGSLVVLAGMRYRQRLRAIRPRASPPTIDDAAIRHIIRKGSLPEKEEGAPIDMDEVARAEEEFWAEPWDEPEEYRS